MQPPPESPHQFESELKELFGRDDDEARICKSALETLAEQGINEPSAELLEALISVEGMRLIIQKKFRSWLPEGTWVYRQVREKRVRARNDKEKKYANSLSFVVLGNNPNAETVFNHEVEMTVLFRFPSPRTVTVEITCSQQMVSTAHNRCRPHHNFTEHLTAKFHHSDGTQHYSRAIADKILRKRSQENIKAFIHQALTVVWE